MNIIEPIGELRFPAEHVVLLAIQFHCRIDLSVLLFLLGEHGGVRGTVVSDSSLLLSCPGHVCPIPAPGGCMWEGVRHMRYDKMKDTVMIQILIFHM